MKEQKMAWIREKNIPDEWRWERLRLYRNDLLKASDYCMIVDSPFDKTVWAIYRQALRDLPVSNADPTRIIFPNEPE